MDLWRIPISEDGLPDGPAERITTGVGLRRSISFSADGSKIAYSRGQLVSNIWRVPIPRDRPATWADAEQITFEQAHVQFMDLSSDGKNLVVSSDRSGNFDLWTMPATGGEMVQVTREVTPDWSPRWSPAGDEIAFYSYRSGNRDLWVMPLEGGPARQLTHHDGRDQYPDWSPDGENLVFVSVRSGNRDLWTVPIQGGTPRRLTTDPAFDDWPRYSLDGHWIAFASIRAGELRIWRIPANGGNPEPLTEGPGAYPVWSHDGRGLYFRGSNERAGNIWFVSLQDGVEKSVTDFTAKPGNIGIYGLAVSSEHIYFTWEEDLGDIWVMDVVQE